MFDCGEEKSREGHHQAGSGSQASPRRARGSPSTPSHPDCEMPNSPAAPTPIQVFKVTELWNSSLGRHVSVLTSPLSLAFKIPSPPPHHGARQFALFPLAGESQAETDLPGLLWPCMWGDLLPQTPSGGTFRKQAGFTGDRLGKPSGTRNLAGPKSHPPSLLIHHPLY